jgi:transposase-like protein
MGDRYILNVKCPKCEYINEEVYYAPTCGFTSHKCEKCGKRINLAKYTGITKEMASNKDIIERMLSKMEAECPKG